MPYKRRMGRRTQRPRRTNDQLVDQSEGALYRCYTLYVSRPEHARFFLFVSSDGRAYGRACPKCIELGDSPARCSVEKGVLGGGGRPRTTDWADPSEGAWKTNRAPVVGVQLYSACHTACPRAPHRPESAPVSASSDVADSLFSQSCHIVFCSSLASPRAMATNGLNLTYTCHCLNVRVTHQPTSDNVPPADQDFVSVHCGDNGIAIVRLPR